MKEPSKREELEELFGRIEEKEKGESKEAERLLGELGKSLEKHGVTIIEIKKRMNSDKIVELDGRRKELLNELERMKKEMEVEFKELHKMIEKYERRIRYKDEAERQLLALEEIKVMLTDKLRRTMERINRLKVRKGSDIAKLFSEAKELDSEVERSGEEVLDFEREYTKFLSMMRELSG